MHLFILYYYDGSFCEENILFVLQVMSTKQEKPQILEPLQNITVYEGETTVLRTQVTGNPTPEVKWFKDEKPVTNLPMKKEDILYTCTLNKITESDSAKYSVTATNPAGTAKSSCNVTVESAYPTIRYFHSIVFQFIREAQK